MILLGGMGWFMARRAVLTRSRDSWTDVSGSPTIIKPGMPGVRLVSTVMGWAFKPRSVAEKIACGIVCDMCRRFYHDALFSASLSFLRLKYMPARPARIIPSAILTAEVWKKMR